MKFIDYMLLIGLAMFIKGGFSEAGNSLTFMCIAFPCVWRGIEVVEDVFKHVKS